MTVIIFQNSHRVKSNEGWATWNEFTTAQRHRKKKQSIDPLIPPSMLRFNLLISFWWGFWVNENVIQCVFQKVVFRAVLIDSLIPCKKCFKRNVNSLQKSSKNIRVFSPSSVRSGQSDRRCGPRFADSLPVGNVSPWWGPRSPRAWPNSESLRRHAIEMAGPGQKSKKSSQKTWNKNDTMKLKLSERIISLEKKSIEKCIYIMYIIHIYILYIYIQVICIFCLHPKTAVVLVENSWETAWRFRMGGSASKDVLFPHVFSLY